MKSRMGLHTLATQSLSDLEDAYVEAAAEAQSKHMRLQGYADELEALLKIRDELKAHPEFSGALPATFWTGSIVVDPDGQAGKQGLNWNESGPLNWT